MIFAVVMTLYFLIQSYILWRFYQLIPDIYWLKVLGLIAALFLTVSVPLSIFLARDLPLWLMKPLYLIGAGWMVGLIYFLIPVLLMDLFRILNYFTHLVSAHKLTAFRTNNGTLSIILVVFYTILFYYGNQVYHDKARREYTFNLADLSNVTELASCDISVAPLKIVMISDLHLGHTIGRAELEAWIDLINAENADYIFISGDLIDNDVRPLYAQEIDKALDRLKAKNGVYGVLGNHEYIAGVDHSIEFFKQANIQLLRDEVILLPENIYLVGRDDKTNADRVSLPDLIDDLDPNLPMIVLDHQPYKIFEAAKSGNFLQFSGHTHDGQVWPWKYAAKKINGISSGLLAIDDSQFLVSSGLGVWGGKFRIGTRSDYVVVNFCQSLADK